MEFKDVLFLTGLAGVFSDKEKQEKDYDNEKEDKETSTTMTTATTAAKSHFQSPFQV